MPNNQAPINHPLRILFVNRMASMVRGGGETFDLEISKHLERLGCRVSFLSGIPLCGAAKTPVRRARSFTVRSPYTGWFPWDKVRSGWRLRLADFWMFEKRAVAWARDRRQEFDVVQVCELPTFVHEWKRLGASVPVVIRLTAPDYVDEGGALAMADAVIASGATLEKVRRSVRPDCVDVPNAVDADVFSPNVTSFRRAHGISDDAFVVLYVARFQSVKDHKTLVNAYRRFAQHVPHSRLVLVGSGPLRGAVRAQCKAAGMASRVLFLGELPYEQLPAVYAGADLKVIASFYESFCFAALEAMAAGLPLVVTDTEWVPGLIGREQGGAVVPIGDAAAMSEAMLHFARDPEARREKGAWNREKILREYRWETSARKLRELYARLHAERRAA